MIGLSSRIPTAAISAASTMKTTNAPDSDAVSDVRSVTSSQMTASDGAPLGHLLGHVGRIGQRGVDRLDGDRPVVGHAELAQLLEHDARVLARDVAHDQVAGRAPGRLRAGG
jgi:hypothetical protein